MSSKVYTVDFYHDARFQRRVAVETPGPLSALKLAAVLPEPMRLVQVSFYQGRLCAALPQSTVNFVVDSATI